MHSLARLLWRQVTTDLAHLPGRARPSARRRARLQRCVNIADVRRQARRRVPRAIFDYVDGAAWDEVTARRNRSGFRDWSILPRVLAGVADVDLSTTLLGRPVPIPVIGAPTGSAGLVHHRGELAIAGALHRAGTVYAVSMQSSHPLAEVYREAPGSVWQQIYIRRDRGEVEAVVELARQARCPTLVVTADCPRGGQRERDIRNAYGVPPRATLRTSLGALARPAWLAGIIRHPQFLPMPPGGAAGLPLRDFIDLTFDPAVSWEEIRWLRRIWDGALVIKGILHPDDARRAVDLGVAGIAVSNHGGRQLDHALPAVRALPAVVAAVAGRAEVYLDGGIRRGTDILTAIALGARGVMIGRPLAYGIGAGGDAGAERVIEILADELRLSMALAGCPSIAQLDAGFIVDDPRR